MSCIYHPYQQKAVEPLRGPSSASQISSPPPGESVKHPFSEVFKTAVQGLQQPDVTLKLALFGARGSAWDLQWSLPSGIVLWFCHLQLHLHHALLGHYQQTDQQVSPHWLIQARSQRAWINWRFSVGCISSGDRAKPRAYLHAVV